MKKLIILALLLISTTATAAVTKTVQYTEEDGSPTSYSPYKVKVSNGTLTNNGDGTVSINTAGTTTNSFQTISTTSGTSPVADSSTDTLTLTAGSGITVTGDSSTDTVTIASTGASNWTDAGTYLKPNTAGDEMQVFGSTTGFLNIGMATNQPEITYNWTGNSTTVRIYNTEYSDTKLKIGNTSVSPNDYMMIGSDSDVVFIAAPGTGYTTGIGFIGNAIVPINHTGSEALGGLSYSNNGEALGSSSYRWSNVYSVLGNFSGRITAGTDIYLYDGSGESSNIVLQPETGDPGYIYEGYTAQGIYIGYRGSSDSKTLYVNTTGSGVMSLNVEGSSTIGTFEKLTPQASAPGSPTSGMIYTDSTPTPDELCFYDGSAWQGISSGTDANCA